MKKSSGNNLPTVNQSNDRNDGSTAQRLNGSTVPTAINQSNSRNDGSTAERLNGSTVPTAINQSNDRNDGLTPSQERAIKALLTSRSIAAAARQAEVGESSLRRWLREDDNFQDKLRRIREEALSHAALQLQQGVSKAVGILHDLIERDRRIEPGRASLIRAAVGFGFRSSVYNDLIERLKIVEANQWEAVK